MADLKAIDSLRRAEQEAVGFIPFCRYERDVEDRRQTLIVCEENGDLVGFLFWTRGWPIAHIQQVAVRVDARRTERATALVEAMIGLAKQERRNGVTCRCRQDLEAVDFWVALGFFPIRLEEGGRRRIPLIRFYRELEPALFDLGPYVPTTRMSIGPRLGFRRLSSIHSAPRGGY